MNYVNVGKDNSGDIQIYYKGWGGGQPVVFSHGWPLSADAWEDQMFFLTSRGYRCIAQVIPVGRPAQDTWPFSHSCTTGDH